MQLSLFDSLSRSVKPLAASREDGIYRFYNCGPTVYAAAHIGNFRTFLVNDLIRRILELQLGKDKVIHVRNITDVDDKTIRRSHEEHRPLKDVTTHWTDKFHTDCDALNMLRPHKEPTATGNIDEQISMIATLIEKGNAYKAEDGSVYFKTSSFPEYGKLSRIKERQLKSGISLKPTAHDADEKEDATDFALWKAHKPEDGEVSWPSPWGKGRPGWHIECSAMSKKLLGDTIDLHTGGIDLLFPHHENEIAQSECCNDKTFSRHWYHSEHLLVDGKKMSKSLGNLYTLDQLTEMGHSPMAVRYALLAGHPRKQLNFTLDSLHAAEKALHTLRNYRKSLPEKESVSPSPFDEVLNALCDDLNTPAALGALFSIINANHPDATLADFDRVIYALGLDLSEPEKAVVEIPAEINALAEQRWAAKQAKDWATADKLRAEISAKGWTMLDSKNSYTLEPSK